MAIAKEQLRQIISENDVKSVGDIYSLFKESFKDMLQELLEAELERVLVTKKITGRIPIRIIREIDSLPKLSRVSMVLSTWIFPETATVFSSPKSFRSINGIFPVSKNR